MMMMMTLISTGRRGMRVNNQLRPLVARKEPRKKGTAYPPIDRKLPALYISRPKERTPAGPPRVGLDSGAEEEDT